jgi:aminoglycoside 3-N-acetyltransferase
MVFNPKRSPSTVGVITEAFRKREGVHRSIHPTHSICAFGANAKWITNAHENAGTNFGQGTPLHKIMEAEGLILGLGIDFGPVTFIHVLEDTLGDFPIKVYCDKEYVAKVVGANGLEREMQIKAHDSEVSRTRIDKEEGRWIRGFVTEYLSNQGLLRTGCVGEAKSWIIRARDLFAAQRKLLAEGITFYTTRQQYEEAHMGRLG